MHEEERNGRLSSPEAVSRDFFEGDVRVHFGERSTMPPEALGGLDDTPTAWLRQIHSATVHQARRGCAGEGDALVSEQSGLTLVVATADCVPVLMTDRRRIAAVHAGWRGIRSHVVANTVTRLDSDPRRLVAWIGPAIGPCCYEVGEEVAVEVAAASAAEVVLRGEHTRLDLVRAVALQLERLGVEDVRRSGGCTRCQPQLASFRREGRSGARNYSLICRLETPSGR